jgi:hypothetical protein
MQKTFKIDTAEISRGISNFSIGFASLSVKDNVEDATSAGSGSLVTVGSLYGVLTAAHVVDALPKSGHVGIISYIENSMQFQRQSIAMEHAGCLTIQGKEFGRNGPDLGFLRLPQDNVGWLKAKNSFYNLSKHRDDALAHRAAGQGHVDTVVGVIHELTKDLPSEKRGVRKKGFTGIFCGGRPSAIRYRDDFDILDFELTSDAEFGLPNSFEGTSGGAIWRFFVTEKDNKPLVVERRLIGVPFYQSLAADKKRIITYHGPKSIYGVLIDRIIARWPEEASK